jgi:hypothetical protein
MLVRMPIATRRMTNDVPPKDTSGSGTPVTGSAAVTAPMLINA